MLKEKLKMMNGVLENGNYQLVNSSLENWENRDLTGWKREIIMEIFTFNGYDGEKIALKLKEV